MKKLRPEVELLRIGTVDQGKQIEINATINDQSCDLATIVADEKDESLWFQVYEKESLIQIPLEKIEKAIKIAKEEVRSEKWYEKNIYGKNT